MFSFNWYIGIVKKKKKKTFVVIKPLSLVEGANPLGFSLIHKSELLGINKTNNINVVGVVMIC